MTTATERPDEGALKIAHAMATSPFGRRRNRLPEHVYFIQSGSGAVKIGCSSHPESRLRELRSGNPERLSLLAVIPGGQSREQELHRQFAADRVAGEWFDPSPSLMALIVEVAK